MAHLGDTCAPVDDEQVHPTQQPPMILVDQLCRTCPRETTVQVGHLASIHTLLGRAEGRRPQAPHLHRDEAGGRTWIDGQNIDLITADLKVAGKNAPAAGFEIFGRMIFGEPATNLSSRPHRTTVATRDYIAVIKRNPASRSRRGESRFPTVDT